MNVTLDKVSEEQASVASVVDLEALHKAKDKPKSAEIEKSKVEIVAPKVAKNSKNSDANLPVAEVDFDLSEKA